MTVVNILKLLGSRHEEVQITVSDIHSISRLVRERRGRILLAMHHRENGMQHSQIDFLSLQGDIVSPTRQYYLEFPV